jgi:hypothetical protein
MSEGTKPHDEAGTAHEPTKTYEKPAIAWEEEYKPTAFGLSCAKQPGNPGCASGPTVS